MRSLLVALALCAAACGGSDGTSHDLSTAPDLGSQDMSVRAGDLGAGAPCSFNRECAAEARCACDEQTGCFCELGPRGTGRSGVDPCTNGNDCASSLCVEDSVGGYTCSDECVSAADCGSRLPQCIEVALLGRVCARN